MIFQLLLVVLPLASLSPCPFALLQQSSSPKVRFRIRPSIIVSVSRVNGRFATLHSSFHTGRGSAAAHAQNSWQSWRDCLLSLRGTGTKMNGTGSCSHLRAKLQMPCAGNSNLDNRRGQRTTRGRLNGSGRPFPFERCNKNRPLIVLVPLNDIRKSQMHKNKRI